MLYTSQTKKAMKIAFEAHKNQVDKNGIPYIYHPMHLASQMNDEKTICIALLHDVVEDSNWTFQDLEKEGFDSDIIDAIKLLTHNITMPYLDYVSMIKSNELARTVKIADLKHNSDLTRLDVIDEKALKRIKKYRKALEILTSENN